MTLRSDNDPTVLVADDDIDSADALSVILELDGHRVLTCYSGADALAKAKTQRPGIVILDVGLGDWDGRELAKELRQDPNLAGMHLVALTGYSDSESRSAALDAGFDTYLVKPVALDQLRDTLRAAAATLRNPPQST